MADELDLAERVRRLEVALADVQAQLAARPATHVEPEAPAQPAPVAPRDLEALVGTYWLSRIGVLTLITGLAWFIALHFGELGPALRVVLGYGLAGVLAAAGVWFARSQRLFGHVVLGGALAIVYFVTYALHFVDSVRILDNTALGLGLLVCVVLLILAVAQRLGSETIAGIALFLGFHTSFRGDSHVFTLVSTVLLATSATYLLVKNRWVLTPLSSMVAVYASHAFGWMQHTKGEHTRADLLVALAFAWIYFVVFANAVLLRPRQHTTRSALSFSLGNGAAFVLLGAGTCWTSDRPLLGPFLVLAAVPLLICSWIAHRKNATLLIETHLGLFVATATWALAELLPTPAFGVAAGALCVTATWFARRASLRFVPAAALATLGLASLVTAALEQSVLAQLGFGVAAIVCVELARDSAPWARLLRGAGAVLAAIAGLAAVDAVGSYRTLGWAVAAFGLVTLGIARRERALRMAGLGVLALAAGKLLLFDLARLPTDQRILTFIASGAILLGMSFAYSRYKDRLQRLL